MKNAYLRIKNAFKKNLETNKTFKSQIPNILTCSRALAPITIIPLVLAGNLPAALIVGSILASTDFFDGMLARKWNVKSEFGTIIDPVVDKIFSVTLLLTGAILNPIIFLNIIPEIGIATINFKLFNSNKKVSSSKIGKIKTWILSIDILLSFIPSLSVWYKILASYITFGFQSATLKQYIKSAKNAEVEIKENKTCELTEQPTEAPKKEKSKSIRSQEKELLQMKRRLITNVKEKRKETPSVKRNKL